MELIHHLRSGYIELSEYHLCGFLPADKIELTCTLLHAVAGSEVGVSIRYFLAAPRMLVLASTSQ